VKKVQRSFAVEYKSGRRRPDNKAKSIWGDLDLKSVARNLQDDDMPFLQANVSDSESGNERSFAGEEQGSGLLTLPIEQETNASALQETRMADEQYDD